MAKDEGTSNMAEWGEKKKWESMKIRPNNFGFGPKMGSKNQEAKKLDADGIAKFQRN